jgi:hypothetical protein
MRAWSGDHVELGIDQHRPVEPEFIDATRELPDLFVIVSARIPWV